MIRAFCKALRANDRGNSTVELGLVMPVLLTMALGGVDLAMGFAHKMKMQHYAQIGADYVVATIEDDPQPAQVKQEIEDSTGIGMNNIKVDEWVECDGVKKANAPKCNSSVVEEVMFMEITVTDTYDPILNIPGFADFVVSTNNTGSVTVRTK